MTSLLNAPGITQAAQNGLIGGMPPKPPPQNVGYNAMVPGAPSPTITPAGSAPTRPVNGPMGAPTADPSNRLGTDPTNPFYNKGLPGAARGMYGKDFNNSGPNNSNAGAPNISPSGPPQAGGTDLSGIYNFFKSDLQNQQKQALAGTQADAAARGVYYGTPLTGSEADINTQYLRGLGQLQAGMYGNEQQNQIARLALATQLTGMMPQMQGGQFDPTTYQMFGQLLGPNNPVAQQRTGPGNASGAGNNTQSQGGASQWWGTP